MEWQEITIKTGNEAVEAIASVFHQLGAGGVVVEDQDTHKLPYALVKGYLPVDEHLSGKLDELQEELAQIARRLNKKPYEIGRLVMNEEDWANAWKKYFKPLKIGERIVVRPTWEPYQPQEGEIVLDIDPGMAFGTGSHASTSLCIRLLEKYIQPGAQVFDVGTGTGILAMCAARLGARVVWAVDDDPVAVRVARENITLNALAETVKAEQHDLLQGVTEQADVIVANIIADVILALLPQVKICLAPQGVFIASGIIAERKDEIIAAAAKAGFSLLEERGEEEWAALAFRINA
ncbi:MAG: 50S ribosomal protein L11 methyltransferase [Clostridia bacterium]|jgi:ribosomal protein L11 methyltransferase|nr:50S ribosomal protein L11 methyltransferase [Clostridia bacterium]